MSYTDIEYEVRGNAAMQFGASDYATAVSAGQQVFNGAAVQSAETSSPGSRLSERGDAHLLTLTGGWC